MAAQGNEEKRKYERRMDARRGTLPDSTLEDMMEDPPLTGEKQEFEGSNQRAIDRRVAIRRQADRDLHDLLTA